MLTIRQLIPPLELLLHTISTQYLSGSYCVTVVSETAFNFNFPLSFINIDPRNDHKHDLVEKLLKASEQGCSDYIVIMKNPQIFMTAFGRANRLGILRRNDKKLIFLPIPSGDYIYSALEMLAMAECKTVANLLLILPDTDAKCESYNLVTHKFVGSESEIDQPLFLDRWMSCTQRFDHTNNLFPHDMMNMMGKKLRVSCFTCKPYVLLDLDPAVAYLGRDGIDIRIIDELCRYINCSVSIVREDKDLWGQLYKNNTGIGILGSVAENRADIGITGLYAWFDGWQEMDISVPYANVAVTCLVPAPRILAAWQTPLLPFSKFTWLAVIITFCFGAIGLYIAKKGSSDKVLLIVFGTMITQSQHNATDSWRNRSIIGWLLVTGFILVSAYGAGLASTFTVPIYEASINTVQDIIDRDIKWGALHDAWIYSLESSPEPRVKNIVKLFRVYSFEELKKRTFTRSMAFGIEDLAAGTFGIPDYITEEAAIDMQVLLEDFYNEQCVIAMNKNSPYAKILNQMIGRLHQSGLLLAWKKQVTLKYMNYKVQLAAKSSRTKNDVTPSKPFDIKKIQGVFIVYLIGVLIAIILFWAEIIFFYHKHRLDFRYRRFFPFLVK